jgi:hypothetical protein
MASLEMNINHQLPQEEATQRIQSLLQRVKSQYGDMIKNLHEEWNGNKGSFRFTVAGFDVSGILNVKESTVELNGDLPFAASFFKSKIKSVIQQEAEKVLAKDV